MLPGEEEQRKLLKPGIRIRFRTAPSEKVRVRKLSHRYFIRSRTLVKKVVATDSVSHVQDTTVSDPVKSVARCTSFILTRAIIMTSQGPRAVDIEVTDPTVAAHPALLLGPPPGLTGLDLTKAEVSAAADLCRSLASLKVSKGEMLNKLVAASSVPHACLLPGLVQYVFGHPSHTEAFDAAKATHLDVAEDEDGDPNSTVCDWIVGQ